MTCVKFQMPGQRRPGVLCGPDINRVVPDTTSNCPLRNLHTPCPTGYLDWYEWAQFMSKTHHAVVCAGCGLYKIWLPGDERQTPSLRATTRVRTSSLVWRRTCTCGIIMTGTLPESPPVACPNCGNRRLSSR